MANKISTVPNHVAIIMDGNGRWAKKRFMPRVYGHRKGVQTIKDITIRAHELGIKILTLYAFSTENWNRPKDEVEYLMKLPKDFFNDFLPEIIENNVKVDVIGDIEGLPEETHETLQEVLSKTKHCTGMILNFAINYGSRQEITTAFQHIAAEIKDGTISIDEINEELIGHHLFTAHFNDYRDPDLIIRTSGEQRLSNFLLWQAAYSEFYFTKVYWPDFNADELDKAIEDFNGRQRSYGKVIEASDD